MSAPTAATAPPAAMAAWADAGLAAALLAIDPAGLGGVAMRARHGPVRTAWLEAVARMLPEEAPLRRLPPGIADDRLLGGLDLAATLAAGRPVASRGLLAEADGGLLILPMAERAGDGLAARLTAALDTGEVRAERDGLSLAAPARVALLALDEGAEEDEAVSPALADRLAFRADLTAVPHAAATPPAYARGDIERARAALPGIETGDETVEALVRTADALGIGSARAALFAARAARALRALLGARIDEAEAAAIAGRLVLAPRATRVPATEAPEEPDQPPDPPSPEEDETDDAESQAETGALADRVLEAAEAALPAHLLAGLAGATTTRQGALGRAGAERRAPDRGRPLPSRPGRLGGGARVDVVGTLRAAAPWQRLRQARAGRVAIRAEDIRIRRFRRHSATATVFVVDASGSAAAGRLAEAKGAVELLLAEAYVRRDQVALVAFRGTGAEVLLPPTAAPALARRRLAALPGGGGTPLAAGLEAALAISHRLAAHGTAPAVVILTDGRANIALDGAQGRPQAAEDAAAMARLCRAAGLPSLVIDMGARPRPEAQAIATAMGGRFLALPRADAARLSQAASLARSIP